MNSFIKQPVETYYIGVTFAGKLPNGALLNDGTVAAFDPAGLDVSAAVLGSTVATVAGNEARVQVQAGEHGVDYRIRFRMTLTTFDVLEEDVLMHVANK